MLENFKALAQLRSQLDDLNSQVLSLNQSVKTLSDDIAAIKEQTQQSIEAKDEARKKHRKFLQDTDDQLIQMDVLRQKLVAEVQSFDQVKRELATNISKRVENELRHAIQDATSELQKKSMDVKAARDSLEALSVLATKANDSLNRLQAASSDIKTKDFDLSRALEVIKRTEQEKLDLQQRLDKAESFAAKHIRKNPRRDTVSGLRSMR